MNFVETNPKMNELERMAAFCHQHAHVFIYRTGNIQKAISKYMFMSEFKLEGFIKPEVYESDRRTEPFPIYNFSEVHRMILAGMDVDQIGVIIAVDDNIYNQVVDTLKWLGINDMFYINEANRLGIFQKMSPRSSSNFCFEVNLSDHCNLNCQCCDHFSPIASENFLDFSQYVKDLDRLSCLIDGAIDHINLEGGEPLLNERLIDYMAVTRQYFPDTPICVITNGLLLEKWANYEGEHNIWSAVKKYGIEIQMTHYPISINLEKIIQQAKEHDVLVTFDKTTSANMASLWIFSEIADPKYRGIKHSIRHSLDLSGKQEKYRWISCYQFNRCIVLREGKIYTCPQIPYSVYFSRFFDKNLAIMEDCYIDIYSVHSFKEIAEFCTYRPSFCNYCMVHKREVLDWKVSKKDIHEWVL